MTEKPPSAEKTAAKSPAKGDDRNVVAVAPGAAGASLEDRIFLFWKNYRSQVVVFIIAVVVAIIARYAWDAHVAGQENEIRAEYQKATTADAKRAFARAHPGHALAGVGLLSVADESYSNGDYAAAQRAYADAAAALTDPIFAARARLGEGVAAAQAGDAAASEPILHKVATDAKALTAVRAEAWYTIASLKASQHDTAGAQDALTKLMELKPSEVWVRQAMQLGMQLPRGAAPVEAPAAPTAAPASVPAPTP